MRATTLNAAAAALALAAGATALPATAPKYVFFVIVDDLGWANVGFHRGPNTPFRNETVTPNIDALAAEGAILDRHGVYHQCTPSRSSFLTGRLPVHVQVTLANPESHAAGVPYNMTTIGEVMKKGGYATHVVGKWDAGMATQRHTPEGRGFDTSLIYFEHKNDYWNQKLQQSTCQTYTPDVIDLWSNGAPARSLNGTEYEEFIFRDRVYETLAAHDPADPLFMLYTPHVAHCPLQVPQEWLAKFAWLTNEEADCSTQTPYIYPGSGPGDFRCRGQYHAMVALLDEVLGNLTGLLKSRGMWEDTLMVLTSDNGGPVGPTESGASNWPLRGGKYSFWEGGVRATAFISGGFVPPAQRGTTQTGLLHIADWYGTFAELAGVDPSDPVAAAAGLPPVDSVNVWPMLSGANTTSPRAEIPLSPTAIVSGRYKLLLGAQDEAAWGGPQYPNASSPAHPIDPGPTVACGPGGCLFDVVSDPGEHVNIAAANPAIVAAMKARLKALVPGFYSNNDTLTDDCPGGITMPCACWAATNVWGGYFGPYAHAA